MYAPSLGRGYTAWVSSHSDLVLFPILNPIITTGKGAEYFRE